MQARHLIDAVRDTAYLAEEPVNALWLTPLKAGDVIVVCAGCRAVVFPHDWNNGCPICGCPNQLYFSSTEQLLWNETVLHEGVRIQRPVRPLKVRRLSSQNVFERRPNRWYVDAYIGSCLPEFILGALCLAIYLIYYLTQ